jgi:glycosyltransferase involved in cell wall biosynthesis
MSRTNSRPLARPRLLYLGFAFPPGVQHLHPGTNPAGHRFETAMVRGLMRFFEVRSVGWLPFEVTVEPQAAQRSPGLDHSLVLADKPPQVWHRWRALQKLCAAYELWLAEGWRPDIVLAYNLSPVFNCFVRSLRAPRPVRVLMLADSSSLGRRLPFSKALRHRLKPFTHEDEDMVGCFDACVGLSRETEKFFLPRGTPWQWMPGGCAPERAVQPANPGEGPVRFGYFGSLGLHGGIDQLLEAFAACPAASRLNICGYGRQLDAIAGRCRGDSRLNFAGLLPTPEDCLRFAQNCDVLINPRPLLTGNENNFPSKVFDYALSGRAILTTGFAGVRDVLGPEAFYLNETDLRASLVREMTALSAWRRADLVTKGRALQSRVLAHYSWAEQAREIAEFIQQALGRQASAGFNCEPPPELLAGRP